MGEESHSLNNSEDMSLSRTGIIIRITILFE